MLGGRIAEVVLPKLFFKHVRMTGVVVCSREMQNDMIKFINLEGIKQVVGRAFAVDQLADAFRYQ